uniref:Threonylcarbamoyl-AMP synthase n=1 Tax=Chelydra serpentina TaxID=8475 RepID=A0A8C3SYD5_CHESE
MLKKFFEKLKRLHALDSHAIENIYNLKGRNGGKPLVICLGDVEHIYRDCHVNVPEELLRDLLPGPVTLVLQHSEGLNKDLNPFTSAAGVRIPNHTFIREVAQACSGPLASTSTNISTRASTLTVSEFQDLWPQLSLIIDGRVNMVFVKGNHGSPIYLNSLRG